MDTPVFMNVLRALGRPDIGLIEQSDDGLLLLGRAGEKLVEHYSFYAVFQTPEEYRLISGGKELGTLPVVNVMAPSMMLIFSGRCWVIQEIDDRDKIIMVTALKAGTPPIFGGDPGDVHDVVITRMFDVLEGDTARVYMDEAARDLLEEGRRQYAKLGFSGSSVIQLGENSFAVATRVGTVKTNTLALALRGNGFEVESHDGFLTVRAKDDAPELDDVLARIASGEECFLFNEQTNLIFEKFHPYLTRELLELDALSSRIDRNSMQGVVKQILTLADAP